MNEQQIETLAWLVYNQRNFLNREGLNSIKRGQERARLTAFEQTCLALGCMYQVNERVVQMVVNEEVINS